MAGDDDSPPVMTTDDTEENASGVDEVLHAVPLASPDRITALNTDVVSEMRCVIA